jgi:hypothetical protein
MLRRSSAAPSTGQPQAVNMPRNAPYLDLHLTHNSGNDYMALAKKIYRKVEKVKKVKKEGKKGQMR